MTAHLIFCIILCLLEKVDRHKYCKQSYFNMVKKLNDCSYNETPSIIFKGVRFESTNYKVDQDELNDSMSQGYRIVGEYPTSSGVVFSLTKNVKNHQKDPKQKLMDDYVDSTTGDLWR